MKTYLLTCSLAATIAIGVMGMRTINYQKGSVQSEACFAMNENPFGQSFEEWTKEWWRHILSFPCDAQPLADPIGLSIPKRQTGPVYFLAGTNGGAAEREVTISANKAIFLSLVNMIYDYPCLDTAYGPVKGQTLESFLTEGATRAIDLASDMIVTLDGQEIPVGNQHRVTTDMFYFTGNPKLVNCFDACITGEAQAAVSDGYWMMLKPLTPGRHELTFAGKIKDFFYEVDVTYHLNIEEEITLASAQ